MNVRVVPHKRGRGKWAVDYRCPVTKKRKYESFASKKAAVARKKKLEGEHASGTYRPLHAMTWPDFVAEYREKVQIAKKLNTRKVEDGAIAMFQKHCSPTSLRAITTKTVDEFRTKRSRDKGRKNKTVSGDTVNKELRALRTILKKAHEWHYLPEVPKFTLKKTSEPEPRAIPIELFTAILDAISVWDATVDRRPAGWRKGCKAEAERKRKVRHKAPPAGWWLPFLSSAYYAGLRWGELLGLKWNDLRFTAAPSVRIWNEKCNRWDYVPLSVTLAERLQTWMATAAKVDDSDLVFPHSCHSRTILAIWKRLQKLAGIEEQFRFHDLRVSFCTNLVATGVEAPQLKQLARHRSIETTMKYYRGRTEEADRRVGSSGHLLGIKPLFNVADRAVAMFAQAPNSALTRSFAQAPNSVQRSTAHSVERGSSAKSCGPQPLVRHSIAKLVRSGTNASAMGKSIYRRRPMPSKVERFACHCAPVGDRQRAPTPYRQAFGSTGSRRTDYATGDVGMDPFPGRPTRQLGHIAYWAPIRFAVRER